MEKLMIFAKELIPQLHVINNKIYIDNKLVFHSTDVNCINVFISGLIIEKLK